MRNRNNIARGTKPAPVPADVGGVPIPLRVEVVTRIITRPIPIAVPEYIPDFIGEEDTLEKML